METADIRTRAVLLQQVGLTDALTPAMRLGPWTGRLAAGLAILGVLVALLPYRRREQDTVAAAVPEEHEPSSEPSPVGGS